MRNTFEKYRMVPMIVVMGTIFFLSHQTGDSLNLPGISGIDKLAHLSIYGLLAFSIIFAHSKVLRSNFPVRVCTTTLAVCLLYGLSDEYHQSFIPGRFVSSGDIVADMSGAILACLCWVMVKKFRTKS